MKSALYLLAVIVMSFALFACGGGGESGSSTNTQGNIVYHFNPTSIDSSKLDGDEKVAVTAECVSNDVFASSCTIDKVMVTLDGRQTVSPLNLNLKIKEKKTFDVVVLGHAEKNLEPFSYLHDSNPSTAVTGWTSYSETIGNLDTKTIAYGNEVCTQKLDVLPPSQIVNSATGGKATFTIYGGTPPYSVFSNNTAYPPSPNTVSASGGTFSVTVTANSPETTITYTIRDSVGETKTASLNINKLATTSVASTQTCEPTKTFSAVIPDYTPGTLLIKANNQKLEETSMGVLSGDGTGTVKKVANGYQVELTFASGVTKGVPVTASYITPLKQLSEFAKDTTSFKLIYGSLTLYLHNNVLIDSSGTAFGVLEGKKITFLNALGYKGSPIIVSYVAEPFNASGGEIVGKGNGLSKSFTVKTKYAPLVTNKLNVFSEKQPGIVKSVNSATGEIVVEFANAPANNENILASYVIAEVNKIAKVELITPTGPAGNHNISVRLKRP